jgi:hypothetical protein
MAVPIIFKDCPASKTRQMPLPFNFRQVITPHPIFFDHLAGLPIGGPAIG